MDIVWKLMFVLFQIAGAFFLVKSVYVDRKELVSILKGVAKKPKEEPLATWLIAYTLSFVLGGVLNGCGFGLVPLYILLGVTMSLALVYIMYHLLIFMYEVLMTATINDIKLFVSELFSKETLKFVICLGSPFLIGYLLKIVGTYVEIHVSNMLQWPIQISLYLIAVLNVFLPFILLSYYETITEKLSTYISPNKV